MSDAQNRLREHEALRAAQEAAYIVADHLVAAAGFRAAQSDRHASRDASTYRELAKIVRGERDGEIVETLKAVCDVEGWADLFGRLDAEALVRLVENEAP
jgi:hypothetical protein